MRMRKKSNLDERMDNLDGHLLIREPLDFYSLPQEKRYNLLDIPSVFGNRSPLWLELGAGKGKFAFETASEHPEINLIAVEKISNVIVEPCERAIIENPSNLAFMNCAAENLLYYLPEHCSDRIFLNFSCPYPKYTYRNRRLTYYRYLEIYKKLLTADGVICFKTDNRKFFEFSLQSFSENGYKIKNVSLDLHADDYGDGITTEYEDMFISLGKPIYFLEAYL